LNLLLVLLERLRDKLLLLLRLLRGERRNRLRLQAQWLRCQAERLRL
jgi:hypothetical protein